MATSIANRFDALSGLQIKDAHLEAVLRGKEFLVHDGGMGTMLQAAGLAGAGVVPDLLNLSHPAEVSAIHAAYVKAGAQAITTNTFGANRHKLEGRASVAEVFQAAAENVRAAGAPYVVADIGPIGELMQPMGTLSFEEAYDLFAEQVDAAVAAGCDIILLETLSDLSEARAALLAAKEHSHLPVFVTMTFEEDGRTFLGTPPEVAAATLSAMGANAVGMNCSLGPAEALGFAKTLAAFSRVPVLIQPNAGLPRMEGDETIYDITPEEFAQAMDAIMEVGVSLVGGCCGTTPQMISQVAACVKRRGVPAERTVANDCVITSGQQAVVLHEGTHEVGIIGERINPTGKPKLKAALREGNLDYLVGEAVTQRDLGADLLDVNVGLPEIDEPAVLVAAVQKLQSCVTLPLVLDSSDTEALERACRLYCGKPLINSVNGKQENMDAVLPIAAKYGCCVIGLCLDEGGIPPTAEERFAIAQKIVNEAAKYGIPAHDIVIDCLTMAVATNQKEASAILDAIKLCKEHLGVRTALGVSNISFGLPQRNLMSSNFLSAAFGAGLDLPIINPNAARYRDVVRCYRVINGQDEGSVGYIEYCNENDDPYDAKPGLDVDQEKLAQGLALIAQATGGAADGNALLASLAAGAPAGGTPGTAPAPAPAAEPESVLPIPESLADAKAQAAAIQDLIIAGRKEPMKQATEELLANHDALDLIDGLFIPTLDEVGVRFDKGTFFLPQLMASAEAVKVGFDVVKAHMAASGSNEQAEDKPIILATVKGDIHDIGKNIVKMLLENYGYRVVDLGRDVDPQVVVDAALEQGIRLIGLSALMTTTVKSMEKTIELLREQVPDAKTFVGGAVLTPDYANTMGATWYAKDAAESARIAEQFFAEQPQS